MYALVDELYSNNSLSRDALVYIIRHTSDEVLSHIVGKAHQTRMKHYSNKVFLRGLIEFTNYCRNDCYYCGIGRSNRNTDRYRLTDREILECCETGYKLGFRTFVLQGGEDPHYSDGKIVSIVRSIKEKFPHCAITLSLGEKSRHSYKSFYAAGADRYLLRHETADEEHYRKLHPEEMSLENRKRCLYHLKEIGYQVGAGFMVGSPYQTAENLADDLIFLKELEPHMVGIGPFIPHMDTKFKNERQGSLELTILMLALTRLLLPKVLLPATTALGTIHPRGREMGIMAGANVVMPNLSPKNVRKKYSLYDNKICTGDEAAECRYCIERRVNSIGFEIDTARGDYLDWRRREYVY